MVRRVCVECGGAGSLGILLLLSLLVCSRIPSR
jgi:hypothetical protein